MSKGLSLFLTGISVLFMSCSGTDSTKVNSLTFPKDTFTEKKITVSTDKGQIEVSYHLYEMIPYETNIIDKDYQSLNVRVPVAINGKKIDTSNAPIFLDIAVGGYMSVNIANQGKSGIMGGGPMGDHPPMGDRPPMGDHPPMDANPEDNIKGDEKGEPDFDKGPQSNGGTKFAMPGMGSDKANLALANGFVVVTSGVRGRDNITTDGVYFGKAPAAIVDLKSAVRYIRHNKGVLPGNVDHIISVGCSAGGALSALLGSSGDNEVYEPYLKVVGAANESDQIFASACYSPITDLDHSDMAYEWMFGKIPFHASPVNQELSEQLISLFDEYQSSLNLKGMDNFGILTADNYKDYMLKYYLYPSATKYLTELSNDQRGKYLKNNTWIKWEGKKVSFSFDDFVSHMGRMKGLPAFDDFDLSMAEPVLFGSKTSNARHFTPFSLAHTTGNENAQLDPEVQKIVKMMNAMSFIKNKGCASNWWLRTGSNDNNTSHTVMINLATSLINQGKNVNCSFFWEGGHCADDDPEGLMNWICKITGYKKSIN